MHFHMLTREARLQHMIFMLDMVVQCQSLHTLHLISHKILQAD
jgi:hypothetical protein